MNVPAQMEALQKRLQDFLETEKIRTRIPKEDLRFMRLRISRDATQPPVKPQRFRAMSVEGTGRGTGRGEKPAAPKLLKPLKPTSRRADFVRFIGGREAKIADLMRQFTMTRANVNGYLTNLNHDNGIGYSKDNETVKLILPAGANWKNIGV